MYIGNDLQIAHPSYKIIDDISSGFNGSQTSFALQVSGESPVPFPISTQQVMISVNGVVQEPDPNGNAGFKLLGTNIVFSSAPANGHAFFGTILAGADYVTAGSEFPDGSATAPSFTFQADQDTGWYRNGSGDVGYSSNGAAILNFDGNGLTIAGGKGLTVDTSTLKVDATNNRVGIGTASPTELLDVSSTGASTAIEISAGEASTTTGEAKLVLRSLHSSSGTGYARSEIASLGVAGGDSDLIFRTTTDSNGPQERMRLDFSGKLLLGTTTEGQAEADDLTIATAGITGITIRSGTSNNGNIFFSDGTSGADEYRGIISYSHSSNSLNLSSNAVTTLTLDSSQNATFAGNVNTGSVLTVTGTEGISANLYLIADDGDDNGDGWRINSNQDVNDLTISNNATGSYVDKVTVTSDKVMLSVDLKPDANNVRDFGTNTNRFKDAYFAGTVASTGLTVDGDLTLTGANYNVVWDKSTDDLIFEDSARAIFGTNSDGLEIFHESNNSYISDTGTGGLVLLSNGTLIETKFGSDVAIKCTKDSSVELYHNGTKKFETGAQTQLMYGNLELTDGWSLYLDNGFNNATSQVQNVGANGSSDLRFKTTPNGGSLTTALTLDASQNATFRGSITVNDATPSISVYAETDGEDATLSLVGKTASGGIGQAGIARIIGSSEATANGSSHMKLQTRNSSNAMVTALTLDNDQNATFAGDLLVPESIKHVGDTNTRVRFQTDEVTVETGGTERFAVKNNGFIECCGASDMRLTLGSQGSAGTNDSNWLRGGGVNLSYNAASGSHIWEIGGTQRMDLNSSGNLTVTGTVTDNKGNLRTVPQNNKTSSYQLVGSDAGKHITTTAQITVPTGFNAGEMVTIVNNSGSDITIVQGSGLTLYNAGDASSGNRTLAARGMATILFIGSTAGHISGAGLS